MMGIGFLWSRINKNASDLFRGGRVIPGASQEPSSSSAAYFPAYFAAFCSSSIAGKPLTLPNCFSLHHAGMCHLISTIVELG